MSTVAKTSQTDLIESRIDRNTAGSIAVSHGGLAITNMGEAMEFAKLMAISATAVPSHCRNNPGLCLAICVQAMEWRMSPYAVANKSYVVNDRVAYESQLIHAVIEQRAPITCRLKHSFSGSGESRKCKVWATVRGEDLPLEYESPEIKNISPKNSPLWKTKPDLQLLYNTSRDWARMYFPDVIMGVYSDDELPNAPVFVAKPKTLEQLSQAIERNIETNIKESASSETPADNAEPIDPQFSDMFAHCKTPEQADETRRDLLADDPTLELATDFERAYQQARSVRS